MTLSSARRRAKCLAVNMTGMSDTRTPYIQLARRKFPTAALVAKRPRRREIPCARALASIMKCVAEVSMAICAISIVMLVHDASNHNGRANIY